MIRGTCLGWSIISALAFRFLGEGANQRSLRVDLWEPGDAPSLSGELLVRWRPRQDRPFHGSVHLMPGGPLVVNTSDAGWFRMWPDDGLVEVPADTDPVTREVRLWTTPMLLLSAIEGLTTLHASCIEIGGRAVAVSAPGGFGKTTLAAGLVGRGHGLIAEDITVIDDGGSAVPGPDLLRIRPPISTAIELDSHSEVIRSDEDRIYVRTGRLVSAPVRLSAVVFLKRGDGRSLHPREDARRLADLWQVSFHLPNLTDRTRAFGSITTLADSVPMYDLQRPLEWASFDWTMDQIEEIARA